MEITRTHKKIIEAKLCPYCGSETRLTGQKEVYGKKFNKNKMVVCEDFPECDSYVGCHKTGEPLGRLADRRLREQKKKAHYFFDQLWKEKGMDRGDCYLRLSIFLGLKQEHTHIGMFSEKTCMKVAKWARLQSTE